MDRDDEIDKILKQKFENKILPSEEFENNMKKICKIRMCIIVKRSLRKVYK